MNDTEIVNVYLSNLLNILKSKKEQFYQKKDIINLISELLTIELFKSYFESNKNFQKSEIKLLLDKKANKDLLLKTIRHLLPLLEKRIKSLESLIKDHVIDGDYLSSNEMNNESNDLLKSYFSQVGFNFVQQYMKNGDFPPPQNKHLTICFLDLVGFSTMSEQKEASQMVEILNEFFGQIINTVIEHNGDINKFLGDALLIAFESAEDAVRCCIEILHNDLDVLNSKLDYLDIPEIQIHAGINTGSVVLADIGTYRRRETTFIGDGVNIAARVESICPANAIWLTDMTFASLGNLQDAFDSLGKKKLKGKSQETFLYSYKPIIDKTYRIAIIEYDPKVKEQIIKELKAIEFDKIESLTRVEDINSHPELEKVKAIAVGPSFKSSVNLNNLKDLIDRRLKKDVPIIPILGDKIDKDTYETLEKLKIKTFANLKKKESLTRITNAVTTKEMKIIPKIEKEPTPEELSVIVKKMHGKETNTIIEDKDNDFYNEVENEIVENIDEKREENHYDDKVEFIGELDSLLITIKSPLNNTELIVLSDEIKNFWAKRTSEKLLDVTIQINHEDHLTDDYLYKLLKPFELTKGCEIYVHFLKEPPFWKKMKKQFEFVHAFTLK